MSQENVNLENPDTNDLDRMHAAAKREKQDRPPGQEPIPTWVIFLMLLVGIVAGGHLNPSATGSFAYETSNPYMGIKLPDPRPGVGGEGAVLDPMQLAMKKGASGYAVCGGCHQGTGLGVPGQFPPLAGSDWVQGGTERVIRVVLHGLSGPIQVHGSPFSSPNIMPPQGLVMSDQDLANVLTYVRNSWGNSAPMVTKEMVAAVRAQEKSRTAPWTMAELEPFADKDVPGAAEPAPAAK